MERELVCQGRRITSEQLLWLGQWIGEHRQWSRKRLSRELCQEWDWRNARGRIKDFAARSFLEKLAARGLLVLPALQLQRSHPRPKPAGALLINWPTGPISEPVRELAPMQWIVPLAGTPEAKRFDAYLQCYHYLGLRVVGQNMKYLVRDKQGRDLACLLFGAAAWRAGARDQFVGWDQTQRAAALHCLANNTRYLILPWVKVTGLASHLLSQVARRLSQDWQHKYGHPIYLLESFVERGRFRGTCYRAANWRCVGQTQGRGRQGASPMKRTEPAKDIYLYALTRHFRRHLLAAG
jgi:hypothetical protein